MSFNDGYVEVNERIVAFYEKYPDGSLQSEYEYIEVAGNPLVVVKARAYRTADDERPGVGLASEPIPGKTNFTRDSELMNCETSAWGRALAALGFEVKRGIASANEVRNRSERPPQNISERRGDKATEAQVKLMKFKANHLSAEQQKGALAVCGAEDFDQVPKARVDDVLAFVEAAA